MYVSDPSHPPLTSILTPAGADAVPSMVKLCLIRSNSELHKIAKPLVGRFLAGDPARVEPWKSWLDANTPGAKPVGVPLLVAEGTDDALVRPTTTTAYVNRLCAHGEHVRYERIAKTGHGLVAIKAFDSVRAWFRAALQGKPLASSCPT